MNDTEQDKPGPPPAVLVDCWAAELSAPPLDWRPLSGGRSNALWRVPSADGDVVVKLFRPAAATPLFANDPALEIASLRALQGTGLAPEFFGAKQTPAGWSAAYRHIAGRPWRSGDDPALVARALARLHAHRAPELLPRAPTEPNRLWDEARVLLASLPETAHLEALEPAPSEAAPTNPVFIHGDPTAANVLMTGARVTLIDWQCPSLGDAADDLAVFLSPAMQLVSGNAPLDLAGEARFLAGYTAARGGAAGAETVARYRRLAPVYHWRMGIYGEWRAARGDAAYARGAALELARLRSMK